MGLAAAGVHSEFSMPRTAAPFLRKSAQQACILSILLFCVPSADPVAAAAWLCCCIRMCVWERSVHSNRHGEPHGTP